MQAALRAFALDVRGAIALDAGAAAGGFTKAVLDAGARRVYAVDVGHGQLRGFLRQDPRVVVLERTNIAQLSTTLVPERIDLISLDLSYVSLRAAAPQLNGLDISDSAVLVALVKPMFELELGALPEPEQWPGAVQRASAGVGGAGWVVRSVVRSPVPGSGGAVEFLLHAARKS